MTCSAAAHSKRGVLLKRIAKGSLADKAAIFCGDTIISVNEELVYSHEHAVTLCNASKDEVRFVMLGKSTEVTLPANQPVGITLCNHETVEDGPVRKSCLSFIHSQSAYIQVRTFGRELVVHGRAEVGVLLTRACVGVYRAYA